MKKLFILLAAVVMTASTMAENSIPKIINGMCLGKSTRENVALAMESQGLEYNAELSDSTNLFYFGNIKHEGLDFYGAFLYFLEDTLTSITYAARCNSACADYGKEFMSNIHAKYDELKDAEDNQWVKTTTEGDIGFNIWARSDGENIIVTKYNDSIVLCVYHAESRRINILNRYKAKLNILTQNFDEKNKVTGVAGVKFGDSKEYVRKIVHPKAERLMEPDSHCLNFHKARIGGTTYDYAVFYFTADSGLVSVNLQKAFDSWKEEEAMMAYESVKSQYSRKYSNFQVLKDEPDYKMCACGAFVDGYKYLPITITFEKALSTGGNILYYVQVDYFQIRRNSMYDDEI